MVYIIMAVVALGVLTVVAFIFAEDICMTLKPREYGAIAAKNTLHSIKKNTVSFFADVADFDIGLKKDFTFKAKVAGASFDTLELRYAPTKESIYICAGAVPLFGTKVCVKALWNNNIIGIQIPELTETVYYAVSSANFGSQVMNTSLGPISRFVKSAGVELGGLDVSVGKIIGSPLSGNHRKTIAKLLVKETISFLYKGRVVQNARLESSKGRGLSLEFDTGDALYYINRCIALMSGNKDTCQKHGTLADFVVSKLEDRLKKAESSLPITLNIHIRKCRLTELSLNFGQKEESICIKMENPRYPLNGFSFVCTSAKKRFRLITEGSMLTRNNTTDFNLHLERGHSVTDTRLFMDYDAGRASVTYADGEHPSVKYEGTCTKENGIEISASSGEDNMYIGLKEGAAAGKLRGAECNILSKTTVSLMLELGKLTLKREAARRIALKLIKIFFNKKTKTDNVL